MSDDASSHPPRDDDAPHEGPIKTPKQLVIAVVASFVIPIAVIVLLVTFVSTATRPAAGSDGLTAEAVTQRIQPVGKVDVKDITDAASMKTGEQVITAQCASCHASGALGAPKTGDVAAWAPRLGRGYEALLQSALKGKNAMPAQGGGDFTDFEIGRAVVAMTNQGGAKFAEPKMSAAGASAVEANATMPAPATQAAASSSAAAPAAPASPPTATAMVASVNNPPPLYGQACAVCHAAGVAGAPKFGDKAAWAPRLVQGIDGLTASAIKGKGAMPPKGGSTASDADIKAVVAYLIDSAK